jgi:putative phosphoesterase
MKIALLSDIHSNARALEAVLTSATNAQVDAVLLAGDVVGYYFEARPVLQLIQSYDKPFYLVRGNHEELLLKASTCPNQLDQISTRYGPGIQIALDHLSHSEVKWLVNLPHPLEINELDCSILLCHGSPFSVDEYVYPDDDVEKLLSSLNKPPQVLVMGHTHYPFVKIVGDSLVVNPGSVGQPRNRVPGAHWAVLDTQTMHVELLVERYDTSYLRQSCIELAPNHPYLHEVLIRI